MNFATFTEGHSGIQRHAIHVYATPKAREARVRQTAEASFDVRVDEKATGGRANKRLVEILSEHFEVPRSRIRIVKGMKSREKTVEVNL